MNKKLLKSVHSRTLQHYYQSCCNLTANQGYTAYCNTVAALMASNYSVLFFCTRGRTCNQLLLCTDKFMNTQENIFCSVLYWSKF